MPERARNEVWDTCVEVLGYEPKTESEKRLWGRLTTSLRNADADTVKITAVAEWYHRSWPTIDLTLTALEKWYSHFLRLHEQRERRILPCAECGVGGGAHLGDCSKAKKA